VVSNGSIPVIDGHNDTFLNLYTAVQKGEQLPLSSTAFPARISTAQSAGRRAGGGLFCHLYAQHAASDMNCRRWVLREGAFRFALPLSPPIAQSYALQFTAAVAGMIQQTVRESNGRLRLIRSTSPTSTPRWRPGSWG
jgi:membrane dipeptidase